MPELIDRQALIADYRICGGCSSFENCSGHITMCDSARVRQAINEAQTIEAEPVRHGKLLEGKTFNDQHCSVCGQRFRDDISFILPPDENGFPMPKRCPECGCYWDGGAKMYQTGGTISKERFAEIGGADNG